MVATTIRVKNPCKGICRFETLSDLCIGCRRRLDERQKWSTMSIAEQLVTIGLLSLRWAKYPKLDE